MDSEEFVNLSLDRGEEEGFAIELEVGEEEEVGDLRWCLAGRFLGDKPIHANSMMVRMADVWRPVKGVSIKEAKPGLFLFCFNHQFDMEEVLKNGPWMFDNQLLIMERVQLGVQIENIPLTHADFWVQIHDLPTGFMTEKVGIKLGNYIGLFTEYDKNNNSSFWRQYMRLRVKMDVCAPLKKDTKVKDRLGNLCTVKFKYERLGIFCFVCGVMGHAENRCAVRFAMESDDGSRGWSNELRAETRRVAGRPSSRWLVEERGGGVRGRGGSGGVNNVPGHNSGESSMQGPNNIIAPNNNSRNVINPNHNSPISQIIPFQCPVSTNLLQKEPQSIPNNVTPINTPAVTSSIVSVSKPFIKPQSIPSNIIFKASVNPTHHPATSVNKHVTPHNISVNMGDSSNHSLANQYQHPSQHVLLSQPILTQTNLDGPTNQKIPALPNLTLTPQPAFSKTIDHKNSSFTSEPSVLILNDSTQNNSSIPFPVTIVDEPDDSEEMDIQVERKRRREEENKKRAHIQHFLSAGPGSQDCREQ
jgi:hypothetical protein